MEKVYVITKAELFAAEQYVGVCGSMKKAEAAIRKDYPNAKKSDSFGGISGFHCKRNKDDDGFLMFIHEESIE